MPLYLACIALPLYPVANMLDGLARSYDAVNIALLPPFVLRPLTLIAVMAGVLAAGIAPDATTAMAAFAFSTWTTTLLQLVLVHRCLALEGAGRSAAIRRPQMDQDILARSLRSGPSTCCCCMSTCWCCGNSVPPRRSHYY